MTIPAGIFTYDDAKQYLLDNGLSDAFYATSNLPLINPGPANVADLLDLSADSIIFLNVGGGVGLTTEGILDRPFIAVRVIGPQQDYDAAESLANLVDIIFLRAAMTSAGDSKLLYLDRSGGKPALLTKDSALRYHFTCSYVALTPSGL